MERLHGMIALLLALGQFTDPGDVRKQEVTRPVADAVNSSSVSAARPRVWLITSPNCGPCRAAEAWIQQNGFPFELTRIAPREGDATPTWRFQGADGKWWQVVGWNGRATVEEIARAYSEKNPRLENNSIASAPKPRSNDTGKQDLIETLRQYGGTSGTIVFRPDRKQRATVTDGVTLDVGEITARYDLSSGSPRVTFSEPLPRGTVEKFGFGIGYTVQSATYEPPSVVKVGTNWKTIRISLDD
jgi:hypothetical protein